MTRVPVGRQPAGQAFKRSGTRKSFANHQLRLVRSSGVSWHPRCSIRCALPTEVPPVSRKRLALLAGAVVTAVLCWTDGASAQIFYPLPPYGHRYAAPDGSLRLEVKPREAEVYIDGYYAGTVDDFDGTFQRLRVVPGQ